MGLLTTNHHQQGEDIMPQGTLPFKYEAESSQTSTFEVGWQNLKRRQGIDIIRN